MVEGQKTVLICDDSMLVRKKLRDSLEKGCGVRVIEAADGAVAVAIYQEERPSLVFMDIVMPLKDGIAALQEIRAFDPQAQVVMASSAGTQDHLRRAIDAGASDFVQKPFAEDRLREIVQKLCTIVQGGAPCGCPADTSFSEKKDV